jgi:O-antigen/teichoic acid export membrane protein
LLLGAIGTVITTRILGPSGQGVFAVLTFISGVMITVAGLGLGEAAIVRVGQRRAAYPIAAAATLAAVLVSGGVSVVLTLIAAASAVQPDSNSLWLAVVATAVDVPVSVLALACAGLLNVRERISASSAVALTLSGVTLGGLVVFVLLAHLSVFGAVLAGVVASDVALLHAVWLLRRAGMLARPRWNTGYLRSALGYGLRLQSVSLLTTASNRFDLLLVFLLVSQAGAGRYSVALTIGTVTTMVPYALSYASFPRLAQLTSQDAILLTARIFRTGIAGAVLTAAALAAVVPLAIPLVLGRKYEVSIVPAEIVVMGGVFVSGQWILGRARAARGSTGLLVRSFALSLAVMVLLDLALIPDFGIVGAASASTTASFCALAYCAWATHREGVSVKALLPRLANFRELAAAGARLSRTST